MDYRWLSLVLISHSEHRIRTQKTGGKLVRLVKVKTNMVDARTMASGCHDHFYLKNMTHPLTLLKMDWEQEETTSFQSGFLFLTCPRHILDAGAQPPFRPLLHRPPRDCWSTQRRRLGARRGDVVLSGHQPAATQGHHQIWDWGKRHWVVVGNCANIKINALSVYNPGWSRDPLRGYRSIGPEGDTHMLLFKTT